MHEASIVESLIDLVRQNVPDVRQVRRVGVQVGLLTGVSPDAMHFYFDVMREEMLSPQADLDVTLAPLRAHCDGCGTDHALEEIAWLCPSCGAQPMSFRNGDELTLTCIEVEDGQNRHG